MTKTYALVGMKHWHAEALVRSLPDGQPLELTREPSNRFDPNAVQVWARCQCVGYIGRGQRTITEAERAAGKKYAPGDENVALARRMDETAQKTGLAVGSLRVPAKLLAGWPPRVEVEEA